MTRESEWPYEVSRWKWLREDDYQARVLEDILRDHPDEAIGWDWDELMSDLRRAARRARRRAWWARVRVRIARFL